MAGNVLNVGNFIGGLKFLSKFEFWQKSITSKYIIFFIRLIGKVTVI